MGRRATTGEKATRRKILSFFSRKKEGEFAFTKKTKDKLLRVQAGEISPSDTEISKESISGETILQKYYSIYRSTSPFKWKIKYPLRTHRYKSKAEPGKRERTRSITIRGRAIGYIKPKEKITNVDIQHTILNKIKRTGRTKPLIGEIAHKDIVIKRYESKIALTIIFVLDVSESMFIHIKTLATAVSVLHKEISKHRDRVGIIALRGNKAEIIQHPTTNIYVIAREISKLKVGGSTPLADGLMKALFIVRQEKRRNVSTQPLIVIISDGLATVPLYTEHPEIYKEVLYPAQSDVLYVAKLLRKENVPVIVINPSEIDDWIKDGFMSPTTLLKKVSKITKGKYYGFRTGFIKTELTIDALTNVLSKIILETKKT
ncbi:MAG: VWA domain-containing protein [Candidatus Odinarchaeota archaeon]|nr:VWA domain-containing protein [Candidatus Odinarchaeota archaeon]